MITRRCCQSMPCASSSARMAATVLLRCRLTNGSPASASRSMVALPASAWLPATMTTTSSCRYGAACRAPKQTTTSVKHREICIPYPSVGLEQARAACGMQQGLQIWRQHASHKCRVCLLNIMEGFVQG